MPSLWLAGVAVFRAVRCRPIPAAAWLASAAYSVATKQSAKLTKPFSWFDEEVLKPRCASITSIKQWGAIMFAFIINSIYREILRTSISGAKVAGA
jgi:hypothetical protein